MCCSQFRCKWLYLRMSYLLQQASSVRYPLLIFYVGQGFSMISVNKQLEWFVDSDQMFVLYLNAAPLPLNQYWLYRGWVCHTEWSQSNKIESTNLYCIDPERMKGKANLSRIAILTTNPEEMPFSILSGVLLPAHLKYLWVLQA